MSSTYHRIMAFMSIFDFIASICMALSTLPMPRDNIHPFQGPMIGNHRTCQAQGYFILFGMGGGGGLYSSLSWYFVLNITFKVSSQRIRRHAEPLFYMYALFMAFVMSSYYLSKDYLRSGIYDPFCLLAPEYLSCDYDIDGSRLECQPKSDLAQYDKDVDLGVLLVAVNIILVILPMIIILFTVFQRTKDLNIATGHEEIIRNEREFNDNNVRTTYDDLELLRYSRVMIIQALLYIFAYFLTWIFMIIPQFHIYMEESDRNVIDAIKVVLFPMQGFWNLIIFIYDKAYNIKVTDETKTWIQSLKVALLSPSQTPNIVLVFDELESSEEVHGQDSSSISRESKESSNGFLSVEGINSFVPSEVAKTYYVPQYDEVRRKYLQN